MNSYQQLLHTIDPLKSEGKVAKVTKLPSQLTTRRSKKSVWGVKTHSSDGRRWNNENCAVVPV